MGLYARLREIPLVLLGLGLCRGWSCALFYSGAFPAIPNGGYAVFVAATAVGSLFLALFSSRVSPIYTNRALLRIAVACTSIGTAGFALAYFFLPVPALQLVLLAVAGLGGAVLQIGWCECLGCFNPMRVCLYHAAAIALGALLGLLFIGMISPYVAVAAVVLPIMSFAWCRDSFKLADKDDLPRTTPRAEAVTFPWKPVALMAICSFASGMSMFGIDVGTPPIVSTVGEFAVMALIVAMALSDRAGFNFGTLFKFALPLTVVSLVLVLPSLNLFPALSTFCYSGGEAALAVLVMVIFSSMTYRYGVNAVRVNGIERGIRYLCLAAGWAVHDYVLAGLPEQVGSIVQVGVIAALVVAFMAIFYTEGRLSSLWGATVKESPVDAEAGRRARRTIAATVLSNEFGLTPREEEVLQLLAQGTSLLEIEKALYIAQGTLRAHINHIYTKMAIHSRDELHALIDDRASRAY